MNEYTEEFYRLGARINLPESEEQRVAKYIDGLRLEIRDVLRLRDIYSVIEAVNMANKVESQIKSGSRPQPNYRSPFYSKTSQEARPDKGKQHAVNPPPNKAENEILWKGEHSKSTVHKRNSGNAYAKPSLDICFRCSQPGHRSNECPRRTRVGVVNEEEEGENEEHGDEEVEYTSGDKGEHVACIVRRSLLAPTQEENHQRHNLFRISCTIQQKVCDVIIDSCSVENLVSKALVKKLQLKTSKHPSPYKISWIKKGAEAKVTEVCKVPLSIGKTYKDEITCDVIDMDACHVLLGRPWQFDVNATHKGRENTYEFSWYSKKSCVIALEEGSQCTQIF